MISNIPAFAVHQGYQARHSDMLAAARRGKDAEIELRSGWSSWKLCPGSPPILSNGAKVRWIAWDLASPKEIAQG
jgi:hypothetical protein